MLCCHDLRLLDPTVSQMLSLSSSGYIKNTHTKVCHFDPILTPFVHCSNWCNHINLLCGIAQNHDFYSCIRIQCEKRDSFKRKGIIKLEYFDKGDYMHMRSWYSEIYIPRSWRLTFLTINSHWYKSTWNSYWSSNADLSINPSIMLLNEVLIKHRLAPRNTQREVFSAQLVSVDSWSEVKSIVLLLLNRGYFPVLLRPYTWLQPVWQTNRSEDCESWQSDQLKESELRYRTSVYECVVYGNGGRVTHKTTMVRDDDDDDDMRLVVVLTAECCRGWCEFCPGSYRLTACFAAE